jgi:hypothetical protein
MSNQVFRFAEKSTGEKSVPYHGMRIKIAQPKPVEDPNPVDMPVGTQATIREAREQAAKAFNKIVAHRLAKGPR